MKYRNYKESIGGSVKNFDGEYSLRNMHLHLEINLKIKLPFMIPFLNVPLCDDSVDLE